VTAGSLPTDLPLVAFALGDTPDALLAASTLAFDLFQIRALDHVAVTRPVRFRYTRAGGGFELPFAGVVAISFVGGVIAGARVCPCAGNLTEDEARDVAAGVVPHITAAGYRAVAGLGKGVAALASQLQARPRHIDTSVLVGKWTRGDDALLLEVERAASSGSEKKPDLRHVVCVRVENGPLYRRATARVSGAGRDVVWKRRPGASPVCS
jgi:hypothetical protein